MAQTKTTTRKKATKSTKASKGNDALKVEVRANGAATDGVYKLTAAELARIDKNDTAGRKVDRDLEAARGKDTWSAHLQLFATEEIDNRAQHRHDEAMDMQKGQFDAVTKQAKDNLNAIRTLVDEHHSEAITLAEENQSDLVRLVNESKTAVTKDVTKTRDELLNGQAVLGESVTTAQKTVVKDLADFVKLSKENHTAIVNLENQNTSQIADIVKKQHEAAVELVQKVYNDLDTKMRHFREEMEAQLEKTSVNTGNQHASVRGDLNVVLSLLSDIRKDQIGRPDRR